MLIEFTRTSFFRTLNELKHGHLLMIKLEHPIFAWNDRTSNTIRPITIMILFLQNFLFFPSSFLYQVFHAQESPKSSKFVMGQLIHVENSHLKVIFCIHWISQKWGISQFTFQTNLKSKKFKLNSQKFCLWPITIPNSLNPNAASFSKVKAAPK